MMADHDIIEGDCREVMDGMAAGTFGLVITSPPYNARKSYETALSIDAYRAFADEWVSRIPRLLKDDGAFWLNVGYTKLTPTTTLPLTYLYHPICVAQGFHLVQEVIWHYEGGLSYKSRFSHRTERWQWWVKDPKNFVFALDDVRDPSLNRTRDKRNNPLGKNPTDYWYFDRVVGGRRAADKTDHPCQFPVRMVQRVVRACSRPGDLVLDPFGGSGSVASACRAEGRRSVMVEREREFIDLMKARAAR